MHMVKKKKKGTREKYSETSYSTHSTHFFSPEATIVTNFLSVLAEVFYA